MRRHMFRSKTVDQSVLLAFLPAASVRLVLLACLVQGCASSDKLIRKSDPDPASHSTAASKIDAKYRCLDGYQLQYELWRPADDGSSGRYPLVLCLHGKGGATHAPRMILGRAGIPPCFVLAPKVPPDEFSWAPIRRDGMPYVFELLDSLVDEEAVDPGRIYVTGQSMGGFATFAAVSARPDFFAAAVPVCGGWKLEDASAIHKVPMWVFHGDADKVVPAHYSRDMVKALREAGGTPRYTEYEGVGHNSWVNAYGSDELWVWLFKQRRAPSASSSDQTDGPVVKPVEEVAG